MKKFVFAYKPERTDIVNIRSLFGKGIVLYTGFGIRKDDGKVITFGPYDPTFDCIKDTLERAVICAHFEDDPPSLSNVMHKSGETVLYMMDGKNEYLQMAIEGMLNSMPIVRVFLAMQELNPKEPVAIGAKGLCSVFGGKSFWDGTMTIYEKLS